MGQDAYFVIVQGDTEPVWEMQLLGPDGAPLNLRGATATLRWSTQGFIKDGPSDVSTPLVHTRAMTIDSSRGRDMEGFALVEWQAADTETDTGIFNVDVPVTLADGKKLTADGYWPKQLYVRKRVGG